MYASTIIAYSRLARKLGSFDAAMVYIAIARYESWVQFSEIDWSFHPRSIKTLRSYVAMLEAMGLIERSGTFIRALAREEWL